MMRSVIAESTARVRSRVSSLARISETEFFTVPSARNRLVAISRFKGVAWDVQTQKNPRIRGFSADPGLQWDALES